MAHYTERKVTMNITPSSSPHYEVSDQYPSDAEHRTYNANDVKYPDVTVELTGTDGNAFAILGKVKKAISEAHGRDAGSAYFDEATAGDYDALLRVTMQYVDVI
jgi:hypothetical protein